ncbi:DUF1738 domain-containing protein [Kosakonia cowanii]|uniref:ArdC-like ssDNA-binding domain-containing protein n=1 Tax=Kosakonia cowanii TaxID=208223 RepID=UPI001124C70F|nr:ArdC-like ssDNA-binding domain-containing protein [Kosakonia cowanii]MDP9771103.1 hypothetical protein [Atlantibacter hermannii]TPD59703.1 DUF1738 domain-containing protein [Kosakonia cowanii]TPE00680.1 DUF1738 domain-containing protein [Kosakonia cowanii]
MTMNLHTQTTVPKSAPATSVSSLKQSVSSKTKLFKARPDIYQAVTDTVIEALELSVKPWACSWKRNGIQSGIPLNTPFPVDFF